MAKEKLIDITKLDAVADSERGFELELKHADGEDVGLTLIVLGKHADVVMQWQKKLFQKLQREESLNKKRGKETELDIDEVQERTIESALIRVTGWQGAQQEFSKDLLKGLFKRNPHFVTQVIEASDTDANFTKPA
jgi:hypothetical protein